MSHCKHSTCIGLLTLVYLAGVALFFLKGAALPCKVAYPTAWLAVVLFGAGAKRYRPVACALLFSAAGDTAGALHLFLLQMAFFAGAHVAYIRYFLHSAQCSGRRMLGASLFGGGLLVVVLWSILPHVALISERIGVFLYAIVIAAMFASTLLYRGRFAAGFRCAAVLFVFSDSMIGWNKFVEPVPNADPLIMGTYYAAQYLFALLALLNVGESSGQTAANG